MGVKPSEPWYGDSLAFECRGCGDCCRGPGGYVWIGEDEIGALADALSMSREAFAWKMLRQTPSGLALIDGPDGNCPLLNGDGKCSVYEARPTQCRTWPWWRENVSGPAAWRDAGRRCPGIDQGTKHSRFEIETEAAKAF